MWVCPAAVLRDAILALVLLVITWIYFVQLICLVLIAVGRENIGSLLLLVVCTFIICIYEKYLACWGLLAYDPELVLGNQKTRAIGLNKKGMTSGSSKEWSKTAYPKTLLSIVASVGGLAVFLLLASSVLISSPIADLKSSLSYSVPTSSHTAKSILEGGSDLTIVHSLVKNGSISQSYGTKSAEPGGDDGKANMIEREQSSHSDDESQFSDIGQQESKNSKDNISLPKVMPRDGKSSLASNNITLEGTESVLPNAKETESKDSMEFSAAEKNWSLAYVSDNTDCDLYDGKWVYDSAGPLYTNGSCPIIYQMQNCQGNGRPDKDYENWIWKPNQCDLPRFDPKKFLELMRGKTLAFIGDSVARNQMESMLCILWQAETPKNRGNRKMQRYYFRSTDTTIIRIWSSWLVHQTTEPFDFAPDGVTKLHLDAPDEHFMQHITNFDVIVLSSGHWFAKQSVYILNNEIVGGQLWWPDKSRQQKVNNIEAFGISVETILTAIATHPNYTGLTIVRSYSPDHYEGGAWNTGGSCTGKVRPATDGELAENGYTNIMHEKQVTGFNRALKQKTNKSKLKLMDITKAFSYRHDGHPGPYRSLDPNKITKRGPDGRPPPQDCLHWCMPGPVDTWNEIVLEIIRRELFDGQNDPS